MKTSDMIGYTAVAVAAVAMLGGSVYSGIKGHQFTKDVTAQAAFDTSLHLALTATDSQGHMIGQDARNDLLVDVALKQMQTGSFDKKPFRLAYDSWWGPVDGQYDVVARKELGSYEPGVCLIIRGSSSNGPAMAAVGCSRNAADERRLTAIQAKKMPRMV